MSKILTGKVVSDSMTNTIVVEVVRQEPHPRYKKIIKRTTKIFAHDAEEQARAGDVVRIQEGKQVAKNKAWVLVDIVQKAK